MARNKHRRRKALAEHPRERTPAPARDTLCLERGWHHYPSRFRCLYTRTSFACMDCGHVPVRIER